MQEKIKEILTKAKQRILDADSMQLINEIRVRFLGKNGEITALLKSLKDAPADQRPKLGKLINDLRGEVETILIEHEKNIAEREKQKKLKEERIDITLSKNNRKIGALHPLNKVIRDICDIFIGLGLK